MWIGWFMSFARRIVLDTGVLVSAAIRPGSVPALAFEKALLTFAVCVSQDTLGELQIVLGRSKFDRYAPAAQRQSFSDGFRAHAVLFEPTASVADCPDPEDNKFLALAEIP
jgi:putative PIN family toxin of toxin-antitoxin system